ncbi:glycosyltransferase [uncultured Faecalibaculum sp.]|uniref:glycosyltransferase n=1 Tax=uncultured Faecalibaculum sp. TaxID=1729681 RepID=UPI0026200CED|nr:glycosyltransferase [uncultured Faecalibaculum sp.]
MKVAIVCFNDTFFDRVRLLKKYYLSKGYDVTVISSDFSHRKKQRISALDGADTLIETPPYYKNLSFRRLYSHHCFSQRAEKLMEELKPDIIHSMVPANSLCKTMTHYKKKHPGTKLYFDINDLWPEALPIRNFEWLPVFTLWKRMRDRNLPAADHVFVECELFLEGLKQNREYTVLHFARSQEPMTMHVKLDPKAVDLVYLGSINNIIDINLIRQITEATVKIKPTRFHIIGEGETKDRLIAELKTTGAEVIDHGILFDPEDKQRVFDHCHYGLNIVKPNVMVGLTMKSLDYMIGGLPMLNSIGGDTEKLVADYDLGFNVDRNHLDELALEICSESPDRAQIRRKNMQQVYGEFFSEETFFKTLDEVDA